MAKETVAFYCEKDMDVAAHVRNLRKIVNVLAVMMVGTVLAVIVVSVVFASLLTYLYNDLKNHEHLPNIQTKINGMLNEEEICFPCSDVRLGPSHVEIKTLETFRRKFGSSGEELCCVDTARQLVKRLELIIEKKFWKEVSNGNLKLPGYSKSLMTSDRPAAHLVGPSVRQENHKAPGSLFSIDGWEKQHDIAFMHKVNYRHGRIIVPSAGYYFVYSQVSFLELFGINNSSPKSSWQRRSLSQYIYRYNVNYARGGEELLIQNSRSKRRNNNNLFEEYSSYIGAVVYLRTGDELFVKVSNITLLSQEPKASYFGLYKL